MNDETIIALYWERSESAISETNRKYGGFCHRIADNILSIREDAEECVSDTWYRAWNTIPPETPRSLRAYLGRIVRNLAINRYHRNHAQKRYHGIELILSELEECTPSSMSVENSIETAELTKIIDNWLDSLPKNDRALFIRRYWNGDALNKLARECGIAPGKLAQKMFCLRNSLKTVLEKEGVTL